VRDAETRERRDVRSFVPSSRRRWYHWRATRPREALRRYFTAYEEEIERTFEVDGQEVSFRDLFRRQAERLARTLTAGEPYESFRLPC
jgi:CRISPR/Cas system-associated endonuclease Cas1